MTQGTPEWHAQRCGKITASRLGDLLAKTKSGWGASRANYLAELVAERMTGVVADSYVTAAMAWGHAQEEAARAAYSFHVNQDVVTIDFVDHPEIARSGASPDGLVGDDGLVEIKCPNTATHIATLRGAEIAQGYRFQMQWQMACTGRVWCDFVSFDPRLPEELQLHVRRVRRDDRLIAELEREVRAADAEVEATIAELRALARRGKEAA